MNLFHANGEQASAEEVWDRFIEHLNQTQPLKSGLPHKSFIGSIESYKKVFLESQEG